MSNALITVNNLNVSFPGRSGITRAVRDASFTLGRERLGIVGESGSGKSTLGRSLLGLIPRPGIVTAGILAMIFSWNQFLFSLILGGPATKTVPVAVFNFLSYGSQDYGAIAAAAVLITLPIILLSLTVQRYIVRGLTAGGVKG